MNRADFRAGVHLPNDGHMSGELWDLLPGLRLVKGLLRLDNLGLWDEMDWAELGRRLDPGALVILRLYFPGRLEVSEFVERATQRLRQVLPLLGGRQVLKEIHNEPNHCAGVEGWGKDTAQAIDFSWWFSSVRDRLWSAGFTGLGWPGLAVGEHGHRERTWATENRANVRTSEWVGCHCYWQRPEELHHLQLGGNWRWYRRRWPRRALYVTEAANSARDNPELPQLTAAGQVRQYVGWCRAAAAGGVAGVAFYMLGGSEDWRGFELYPETVRALASLR